MSWTLFKKSLIVAIVSVFLDFLFHYFLTFPMETFTYFVIKFLLAFFVGAGWFSFCEGIPQKAKLKRNIFASRLFQRKIFPLTLASLLFSTLMSIYYRAWELGEAGVPFGSRAPDILGLTRESLLFPLSWWLGHALFFMAGVSVADFIAKEKE